MMIKLKTTTFDNRQYTYLSPQDSHQLAFNLACQINSRINAGKLVKPELLIGIAKGSFTWLKTMTDWLNLDTIATLRVVHYNDVGKRFKNPTIIDCNLPRLDKKRVLLFDNIADTGKTLRLTYDFLSMYGTEKIITSTLFYKQSSIFKPDFYALPTKAWIVFHFEIVETVKYLGSRWLNQKLSLKEIKDRFLTIGLPIKELNEAMKLMFNYV